MRICPLLLTTLTVGALLAAAKGALGQSTPAPEVERQVAPFFKQHCLDCHSGDSAESGLTIDRFLADANVHQHRKGWTKVLQMLRAGVMPPEEQPRPNQADVQKVIAALDAALNYVDCSGPRDPGRVTIRRLNRTEYNNTIRDLMGVDFKPAEDFPADDVGYGFDHIGDVLSLPPLLMEKYLAAAEKIVHKATVTSDPSKRITQRYAGADLRGPESGGEWLGLFSEGEIRTGAEFPKDGEYVVRAQAFAEQAGGEPAKMEFRLNRSSLGTVEVKATRHAPAVYEMKVKTTAGRQRLAVAFVNDYYQPNDPDPNNRDRNLYIGYLEIQGPLNAAPPELPESHRRIFTAMPGEGRSPEACAEQILRGFLRRAYRRPPRDDEVARLVSLVRQALQQGDNFEAAVGLAIQAALVSPHFLFRVERDPVPGEPEIRTLDEHELATRLSYFLWSTMPDAELFAQADAGTLRQNLDAQVRRMLRDPKAEQLVVNFVGQWLQLRNLATFVPDEQRFPAWSAELREAMRRESELFFGHVIREDRSIVELLDSDYTFVNERLARHYHIPGVKGKDFQKVALPDNRRGGVITQASVLTVLSNPTRTSPVKRGRWILEEILGTPPPPPPANVEQLAEGGELQGTLRQRMEQHRRNALCASCHQQMDPLGFGLENFDAIGSWRKTDSGQPIDASGVLPDGRTFNGPAELRAILKAEVASFRRCFTEKMLTYALGRGLEYYDRCTVDDICRALEKAGDRSSELVIQIVQSDPFQKRRAKRGDE